MRTFMLLFFGSFMFLVPLCRGEEAPKEIRVQLFTEGALVSLHLSPITVQDNSLSPSYVKELDRILTYDFSHNGKTVLAAQKSSTTPSFGLTFSLQDKKLQTKATLPFSGETKTFTPIPLTGNLSEDRKALHRLSDTIHKLFFQTEGVASSRILYSAETLNTQGTWIAEIAECDWDGENTTLLTKENSYCITPVAIPKDGQFRKNLFLYVSYKTGQPRIFIASKEEGVGKRVVDIRGNQILPSISKQRDKLAFICDASGRTDLFVQSIQPETGRTGAPVQLFSYPRSTQASPVFSPNGAKIAFVSDKDGSPRIYWIPSETQGKRPQAHMITKKNRENSCPSWSPDGTKIAYSAKTEGVRQIWIYDFTSSEEKQLTFGPGHKENPCWAPNSLHLVFNSTDGNYSDLYVVNLNQPTAIKITKGQGKKHYPSWDTR